MERHTIQVKRFFECREEPLGDAGGAGRVGVGQQDRELVATSTRQQVTGAQLGGEAGADLAQELVAHVVAEGIVDLFEAVQVNDQQGDGAVLAPPCQGGLQPPVEQAAVAQAGEVVGEGLAVRLG